MFILFLIISTLSYINELSLLDVILIFSFIMNMDIYGSTGSSASRISDGTVVVRMKRNCVLGFCAQ